MPGLANIRLGGVIFFPRVSIIGKLYQFCIAGGPLVLENTDGSFLLVGILTGGGLDCSKLADQDYQVKDKTGDWMRVSAFRSN